MDLLEALDIVLNKEHIGDFIYHVRENAIGSDPEFKGNSWDHPRVVAYGNAVKVLEDYYTQEHNC